MADPLVQKLLNYVYCRRPVTRAFGGHVTRPLRQRATWARRSGQERVWGGESWGRAEKIIIGEVVKKMQNSAYVLCWASFSIRTCFNVCICRQWLRKPYCCRALGVVEKISSVVLTPIMTLVQPPLFVAPLHKRFSGLGVQLGGVEELEVENSSRWAGVDWSKMKRHISGGGPIIIH